jgi:hypothetical protein
VTATASSTTGVPNPDKPGWWIVPPWEAGASFCDVASHFSRFDPWWGGASSGHRLAYYTAYLAALEAAPTSELMHAMSLEWRDELLDCIARCVANHRTGALTESLHNEGHCPAVAARATSHHPGASSPGTRFVTRELPAALSKLDKQVPDAVLSLLDGSLHTGSGGTRRVEKQTAFEPSCTPIHRGSDFYRLDELERCYGPTN